jgi:NADPH:quinone reductase-like Zn-dependent oxidoreductase
MLVRKGIKVFATVRSEAKRQRCLDLGATAAIVMQSEEQKFGEWLVEQNDGKRIDAVLDPVGVTYLHENIEVLDFDGRLVIYGLMSGGAVSDPMFLNKMLSKRLTVTATTLRNRSTEYKAALIAALSADPDGLPAIAAGDIKVLVDRTFAMEEVLAAHEVMRQNVNIGKIVLLVTSTSTAIDFFQKELDSLGKRNNLKMN